jgi:hypothetical protein
MKYDGLAYKPNPTAINPNLFPLFYMRDMG